MADHRVNGATVEVPFERWPSVASPSRQIVEGPEDDYAAGDPAR